MNVLIAGAGNMGLTYGRSFVHASVVRRDCLHFIDRNEDKAELIRDISDNPLHLAPSGFVRNMDLVILSVKPQDFPGLAAQLRPYLRREQLALSIMAGITIAQVQQALGLERIVRAMPNLPAQIGQGMTVFTTSDKVARKELFYIQNLLNTTGKTLYTAEEPMIDAATAVSGSGPAYVYYFMSAMMEAARGMGFNEGEAALLVNQTFLGAVDLLRQDTTGCEAWIARVASKGGTTEAALAYFLEQGLRSNIAGGLEAARRRAVELSKS
ncbi:MAG: pyrroline-5-carboxylate reductase [Bacteroidia bacterium]|nr:pyrroline-5-carboxylate reductase [Bacteroidia bacterium]